MDPAQQKWNDWHSEREAELQEPHGWLSLVELAWLGEESKELEHFPGKWSATGNVVTFSAPQQGVFHAEEPSSGPIVIEIDGTDTSLADSLGRRAEIAPRFGKIMVRIRDPHAATRRQFAGVPTYPYDPDWVRQGPFTPFDSVQEILVSSAQAGYQSSLRGFGTVTLAGKKLIVTGEDEPTMLIFHDLTNGETTEAWRAAPVTLEGDTATVDFNRSVNFPAHFTEFGTCPTPPAGNDLPMRVEAGEKMVRLG